MNSPEIDAQLSNYFSYNLETGLITWVLPRQNIRVGYQAGTPDNKGYLKITLHRQGYRAHRLAWFLHYGKWPQGELDHINGNRTDNRIVNLREATRSQNRANTRLLKKSGSFKGAYWNQRAKKWQAICRRRSIGYFLTEEAAGAAYLREARTHFGEFARVA